jgi:hypothetical protein
VIIGRSREPPEPFPGIGLLNDRFVAADQGESVLSFLARGPRPATVEGVSVLGDRREYLARFAVS